MSKKKVLLRGVFINRDTNGEGVLKVGTTLIRVSTVMGILYIWHYGNIIVNAESKVGKNCMLHGDNCIGNNGKTEGCPIIGDNVDIGTGAKILGNIQIANGVKIGAGAVVVKSCLTENATIVGIPAKEIDRK